MYWDVTPSELRLRSGPWQPLRAEDLPRAATPQSPGWPHALRTESEAAAVRLLGAAAIASLATVASSTAGRLRRRRTACRKRTACEAAVADVELAEVARAYEVRSDDLRLPPWLDKKDRASEASGGGSRSVGAGGGAARAKSIVQPRRSRRELFKGRQCGCAAGGCLCSLQKDKYPYRTTDDYIADHDAVKKLAGWCETAGLAAPTVFGETSPAGYRTRAKLAVGPSKEDAGKVVLGIFKADSHEVVPTKDCATYHPALRAALGDLQRALDDGLLQGGTRVKAFDHGSPSSFYDEEPALRYVQLTVERCSGLVELVLVWNGGGRGQAAAALEELVGKLWPQGRRKPPLLPREARGSGDSSAGLLPARRWHSIWAHWRETDPSLKYSVFSKKPEAWEQLRPESDNVGGVCEKLAGVPFRFGPAAFQQANLAVFEQILCDMKTALDRTEDFWRRDGPARMLEICGGVGVIGLSLASHLAQRSSQQQQRDEAGLEEAATVQLRSTDLNASGAAPFEANLRGVVDSLAGSVEERRLAATFQAASASDTLRQLAASADGAGGGIDILIMDPPRRGLARAEWRLGLYGGEEEAAAIRSSSARVVVYMSCGHESFMADAARLCGLDPAASGPGWGAPFKLESLKCYDMFPFTSHVETLGIFVREDVKAEVSKGSVSAVDAGQTAVDLVAASAASRAAAPRAPPAATKLQCQFLIGIEQEAEFRVVGRLLGPKGANMKHIAFKSSAKLRLRGKGSGFLEGAQPKRESTDPLMLCISAATRESYDAAVQLVRQLLEDVHRDFCEFCRARGRDPPDLQIEQREGLRPGARSRPAAR
eukprot:TRINITY_DN80796_c0_g1_i1.p1 TRINITY_DN80796_c0_g1~~TRINITY_DN80796_c0_g1_i1.p1  ORF type:complete len:826 (+),score=213.51 TRINITY_DN80796_c0_g1_i1:121-2598(+)